MKLSLNWLRDFVEINESPEELQKKLTLSTCEVEEVLDLKKQLEGVVVAKVLTKEKHPDADKLAVALVDFGEGEVQVVCGAPNLEVGQFVPFARVGTVLPNGLELKKVKIRGVESNGMICAEDELSIGDNHDGIIVLDETKAEIGQEFAEYLGMDDVVFDIDNKSITHRPDLFSHIGVAREIAAIHGEKMQEPQLLDFKMNESDAFSILVENEEKARRYIGVHVKIDGTIETPDFIAKRLEACGMRSINVIVDIVNYVMLEWGQPMHTFDFNALAEDKIISVRNAHKGEKLVILDGSELELSEDDLVIADEGGPIALAGVMGGKSSEATENTTEILLEVANFDGPTVRRAARRHGIRSEAVLRYEKGQPVNLTEFALRRAVELFEKYAAGEVMGIQDVGKQFEGNAIELDPDYVTRLLGDVVSEEQTVNNLELLGFSVENQSEKLLVSVPWYRQEIKREEELIEEIGRLQGTDSISSKPFSVLVKPVKKRSYISVSRKLREILLAQGLDEIYTYSFYGEKLLEACGLSPDNHFTLSEPLSRDLQYMRRSLIPYHLEKLSMNLGEFDDVSLFEVGHVYEFGDGQDEYAIPGVKEHSVVSGAVYGDSEKAFFRAKGVAETMLKRLHVHADLDEAYDIDESFEKPLLSELMHWSVDGEKIGFIGLVDAKVLKNFSIKHGFVAVLCFEVDKISKYMNNMPQFNKPSEFPAATIDLAFVCENTLPVASLEGVIKNIAGDLLEKIEVFDIYKGKPLSEEEKSVAFHVSLRSHEKTLQDAEVKELRDKIVEKAEKDYQAKIRDF